MSLYRDVYQLERSSYLEFSVKSKTYTTTVFEPNDTAKNGSLGDILEQSVLEHLVADVPVGLFFSGGTDSSLIAAILKKHDHSLVTYSLEMPGRDTDREYSRRIGDFLGLDVQYSVFDQTAFDGSYYDVTRRIDIPLCDIGIFPTYYISQQAAKDVKVVLSGEGGDELFFGYKRHNVLKNKRRVHALASKLLHVYQHSPNHPGKGLVYQHIAKHTDVTAYYMAVMSPALLAWDIHASSQAHKILEKSNSPLFYDRNFYLENMLLRKLDLMTMAHSLEGRVPLLSPQLVSYSNQHAAQEYRDDSSGILKPALKTALEGYLPRGLVDREKSGFGFNPETFIRSSTIIRDDFLSAYDFLKQMNIAVATYDREWIFNHKPGLVLASILLHRSVINLNV
jgi:asparagine synthase (glutamine-hydrolysing)